MTKTVLLADDSATIRRVVELTFNETEIHVDVVDRGTAALERLAAGRADLVLADVVMPEPNGYEICRRIKRSNRPIPVLLLAGTFEPFDAERARACGADGHLVKPFESETLLARVRALLEAAPSGTPAPETAVAETTPTVSGALSDEARLEALVRAVAERLTLDVVREVAREVVPVVAERVVRERIRELERGSSDAAPEDLPAE